jgi:hypothetical protein
MRSVLVGLIAVLLASLLVTGPPLPLPSALGCRPAYAASATHLSASSSSLASLGEHRIISADIRQGGLTVDPRHGTSNFSLPDRLLAGRAREDRNRGVEQLVLPGVDLVQGEADTSPLARLYRRLVP